MQRSIVLFFFFFLSSTLPTGKCVACCRNYPLDGQREELTNRRRRWLSRLQRDEEEEEEVERKDRRVFIRERAFGWFSRCVQQLVPALHSLGAPPPPIFFLLLSLFFLKKKKKKKIYIIPPVSLFVCVCVSRRERAARQRHTIIQDFVCARASVCVSVFFSSLHDIFFFFLDSSPAIFDQGAIITTRKTWSVFFFTERSVAGGHFFFFLLKRYIYFWVETRGGFEPGFQFFFFLGVDDILKEKKTNRSKRVCVLFARPPPGLLASRSIFSAVEKSSRCNPMLSGQI